MRGRRRFRSFRLRYHRLLAVGLLAAAVVVTMVAGAFSGPAETAQGTGEASSKSSSSGEAPAVVETSAAEEMRGVWVPMMSLQMEEPGEEAFQKKFDNIIQVAQEKGMNALIVHVRPYGDALYPSEYFPWSHIVSGTQGVDPGFDPLAYMVEATHKAGMEFHAWVNPLRIQSGDAPSILSQDNPYHQWKGDDAKKGWTVETYSGIYYNPAYEGVRSYIAEGVRRSSEITMWTACNSMITFTPPRTLLLIRRLMKPTPPRRRRPEMPSCPWQIGARPISTPWYP